MNDNHVLDTKLSDDMLSRFSHARLCVTPWTATHQAPLSTGFSRQEYWTAISFSMELSYGSI